MLESDNTFNKTTQTCCPFRVSDIRFDLDLSKH